MSEVFAADIHPGARFGKGILLDHGENCWRRGLSAWAPLGQAGWPCLQLLWEFFNCSSAARQAHWSWHLPTDLCRHGRSDWRDGGCGRLCLVSVLHFRGGVLQQLSCGALC